MVAKKNRSADAKRMRTSAVQVPFERCSSFVRIAHHHVDDLQQRLHIALAPLVPPQALVHHHRAVILPQERRLPPALPSGALGVCTREWVVKGEERRAGGLKREHSSRPQAGGCGVTFHQARGEAEDSSRSWDGRGGRVGRQTQSREREKIWQNEREKRGAAWSASQRTVIVLQRLESLVEGIPVDILQNLWREVRPDQDGARQTEGSDQTHTHGMRDERSGGAHAPRGKDDLERETEPNAGS